MRRRYHFVQKQRNLLDLWVYRRDGFYADKTIGSTRTTC